MCDEPQTLYKYVAFYEGRRTEIYAESSEMARTLAMTFYSPPRTKRHTVLVILAEKEPVQLEFDF